jgi:hypothetical protein
MKSFARVALWTLFVLAVLSAVLLGLWFGVGAPHHPITITVDDGAITMPAMQGADWLFGLGVGLLAAVVVLVVVPLALLFGFGIPALLAVGGLVLGLLAAGFALAVVCSPLLLIVLPVWWLARRNRRAPAVASTTIAS